MQSSVRRAAAFAVVATAVLATPVLGAAAAVPFVLLAIIGRLVSDGPVFELFARPSDRIAGQLRTLTGFALAATGLALLVSLSSLPAAAFIAAVLIVGFGNLAAEVIRQLDDRPLARTLGFLAGGATAAAVGLALIGRSGDAILARIVFLAVVGGLVGALLRALLPDREDPLIMLGVAFPLWALAGLGVTAPPVELAIALGITGAFGYLSWALGTASVPGMLTGVIIGLLTIVIGGYGWFAVLIAFFGLGGVATQYRYDDKRERGAAEPNRGARGSSNVLGNASVALAATVGYAASPHLAIDPTLFLFAFGGSLSTALADTLSSEIGVLFDAPRLITDFREVSPGTDGGVTWQGEIAGLIGAIVVAGIAAILLDVGPSGAAVLTVAGMVGMNADSVLGATLEGGPVGNQGVNFLATLVGAIAGVGGGVLVGAVML